jgi:acetolactate synthase I/II/III large subunit
MSKRKNQSMNRRSFLASAAAGTVVGGAEPQAATAQEAEPSARAAALPAARQLNAETAEPAHLEVLTADHPGSDFMVDVLKSIGFEYIAANPGSSFRGLHESIINYGGNSAPELLTCCHEESSVAIADGYAKVENRPMAVMAHSNVGLQHASMAVYNAYAGRAPIFVLLGNTLDAASRRPGAEWYHSAQDPAEMVRDITKWDDTPGSLTHFAESAVRAYRMAMTPPLGPVLITVDSELQERPMPPGAAPRIPRSKPPAPPAGDEVSVSEIARLLVAADNPVLLTGRAIRTAPGMDHVVELAELLQMAVVGDRFPTGNPLSQTAAAVRSADLILGLEVPDFWGVVHEFRDQLERSERAITKSDVKLVSISAGELYIKPNNQAFQRFTDFDIALAADAEATLPSLIEACKRLITAERRTVFNERAKRLAAAHAQADAQTRTSATYAWDASPVSTPRLSAELWDLIRHEDWALVGGAPSRLWNIDKHYRTISGGGAAGIGYTAPASIGAGLAHRKYGRICVSIQNDGDLMYGPGVLWTAAHHRIPVLMVMHNNRAYHQEVMHIQRMANRHQRGITNAHIGTRLEDPFISYASLAGSLGVHGEGPVSDPKDLGAALRRALDVVKHGEPALVDVVTQPR